MDDISKNKPKKHICAAVLAHVDAGKTTLSESILYNTGTIRNLGRVDKKDAFLDTFDMEKERGITIFSKQAIFKLGDMTVTLMDTPGHVDFSAEMERTLQILDIAILVISGADGVQGHTETLWRLLKRYNIPTFIFVNKMDQLGTDKYKLLEELTHRFGDNIIDFTNLSADEYEHIAMCDEDLLDKYVETDDISVEDIKNLINNRKLFPCYFGSALKVEGVNELLDGIATYVKHPEYEDQFGAKIYKVLRDEGGKRLTFMKITGGCLETRNLLSNNIEDESNSMGETWREKVNQIRIYSGDKYETVSRVESGTVCAVTGLSYTYPGEGLGIESDSKMPILEPVLTYQIILPDDVDANSLLLKLKLIEEEEPELNIIWNEQLGEILVKLMGEVQIDVLKSIILERFGVNVTFGVGNIVYKETISNTVVGVGHFEPLRHYAEVHLLMEPGEVGSGMVFHARCSEGILDKNWQRLILTHLEERDHIGVLTGHPITDMKITVIAGRAHTKHTEGGDFRQATYRAVRQGLMEAECKLLEPYYDYRLSVPSDMIGRAMTDIENMKGTFSNPEIDGELTVITGKVPVATMTDYQITVNAYTKGRGSLSCTLGGYGPCHNEAEVIDKLSYDPDRDVSNPTGSVFCAHGAGYIVPWNEVKEHMHVEDGYDTSDNSDVKVLYGSRENFDYFIDDEEIDEIFSRTFGANKNAKKKYYTDKPKPSYRSVMAPAKVTPKEKYLIVDGYNVIFAWEDLKDLSASSIGGARDKLYDRLHNYQGFTKVNIILVFDAYKVKDNKGKSEIIHGIEVVFTKEGETADQYIEKLSVNMGEKYNVTVATSDGLIQTIARGHNCIVISSRELDMELAAMEDKIRTEYIGQKV